MPDNQSQSEEPWVRRNRGLIIGAMTGSGAYSFSKHLSGLSIVENVSNWLEKHAKSPADHKALEALKKELATGHEFPYSRSSVNLAWEIAEREGFNKRPAKWFSTALLVGRTSLGAFFGAGHDKERSKQSAELHKAATKDTQTLSH